MKAPVCVAIAEDDGSVLVQVPDDLPNDLLFELTANIVRMAMDAGLSVAQIVGRARSVEPETFLVPGPPTV